MKRTPMRRTPPKDAGYTAARSVIFLRAGARCECCGARLNPYGWSCHHRKLRAHGRDDTPPNLLGLCERCHSGIHANPRQSREFGTLLCSWDVPAQVPVMLGLRWWTLHEDGTKSRLLVPPAGGTVT